MRRLLPVYRFFHADKNKAAEEADEEEEEARAAKEAEQVGKWVGERGHGTGGCCQRDEECRLSENVQNGIFFFANHSKRKELETQTKQLQPSKWSARAAIFTHDPQNQPPPQSPFALPSPCLLPIPPLLCVCAHNSFKRRKSRSCAVCSNSSPNSAA